MRSIRVSGSGSAALATVLALCHAAAARCETPEVVWSTYAGGLLAEYATGVAVGAQGDLWLSGITSSLDLPVQNAAQPNHAGGSEDGFVARLGPDGQPGFLTYLGGSGNDLPRAAALDAEGNFWVAGYTDSPDFPTLAAPQPAPAGGSEAFLACFSPSGQLLFSTYFGGSGDERAYAVATTAAGEVLLAGVTDSADLPVLRPVQAAPAGSSDAFLAVLDASAAPVLVSYLGGRGADSVKHVVAGPPGLAYLVGSTQSSDFPLNLPLDGALGGSSDLFVAAIDLGASTLAWSTYLGGTQQESPAAAALSADGTLWVGGRSRSDDFPLIRPLQPGRAGDYDVVLAALAPDGQALALSTYLGGSAADDLAAMAFAPGGGLYLCGGTSSADFPSVSPFQPGHGGGASDGWVARLSASGEAIELSSTVGGSGSDELEGIGIAADGSVRLAGTSDSADFPIRLPWQPALGGAKDACALRLAPCGAAPPPAAVGNTLLGVLDRARAELAWSWADVVPADEYHVRSRALKEPPFGTLAARAASGSPGARIAVPADPAMFYAVAGAACGLEAPF